MTIEIKEQNDKGFATARVDGKKVGVMTFNTPNDTFIIIDHAEVEEKYKGEGVGKKLLCEIVEMARAKHIKIYPLCPFANAMFKKNSDIKDVLKT